MWLVEWGPLFSWTWVEYSVRIVSYRIVSYIIGGLYCLHSRRRSWMPPWSSWEHWSRQAWNVDVSTYHERSFLQRSSNDTWDTGGGLSSWSPVTLQTDRKVVEFQNVRLLSTVNLRELLHTLFTECFYIFEFPYILNIMSVKSTVIITCELLIKVQTFGYCCRYVQWHEPCGVSIEQPQCACETFVRLIVSYQLDLNCSTVWVKKIPPLRFSENFFQAVRHF